MTRVSTAGNYGQMLANIQSALARQNEAGAQVSSQKNATDYKGYAGKAELLTAMRGVQAKVNGFIDTTAVLGAKLDTQATGLSQVSGATQDARDAIANAVAAGDADTLMQQLQGAMNDAVSGLNTRYNGHYLFAGGQVDQQPVAATTLSDLTAAPSTASLFANDQFKSVSRLDESTTVQTGFVASDVGTELFNNLKSIQNYVDTNGAFTNPLTDAQSTFLKGALANFDTNYTNLTATEASNGVVQNQVEAAQKDLSTRADSLQAMTGDITDVDMTKAVANLQAAQIALQASAQVFATLKGSTLLDVLSP